MTETLNKVNNRHRFGIQPLPKDGRDFRLGYAYPLPKIQDLPTGTWHVKEPLEIKDQQDTDMCTAFSGCAVAEDHEEVVLEPGYTFGKTKQIIGSTEGYGANLRDMAQAGVKFGFLEKSLSPFTMERNGRDFCADWRNWDNVGVDALASKHKQGSFFVVDGPYDTFDNIRANMWAHRAEFDTVETGSIWYNEWNYAPGGVIPKQFSTPLGPHAYKIFGWELIGGELYLCIQNSYGKSYGNNGIFYMSRETVNKVMGLYAPFYGILMFKDIDKQSAAFVSQYGPTDVLLRVLQSLLYQLSRLKNHLSPN